MVESFDELFARMRAIGKHIDDVDTQLGEAVLVVEKTLTTMVHVPVEYTYKTDECDNTLYFEKSNGRWVFTHAYDLDGDTKPLSSRSRLTRTLAWVPNESGMSPIERFLRSVPAQLTEIIQERMVALDNAKRLITAINNLQ